MAGSAPEVLVVRIRGPVGPGDLDGLAARVCPLLASASTDVVVCDVEGVGADAATVDALARLQLAACRHGRRIRLRGASGELRALVGFMGLRDVLRD